MAANRLRLTSLKLLQKYSVRNACRVQKTLYCTKKSDDGDDPSKKKSGFAIFNEKQTEIINEPEPPAKELASEMKSGFAKFDQKQMEVMKEPNLPAEKLASEKKSGFAKSDEKQTEVVIEPEPAMEVSGFAKFERKQEEIIKEPETPSAQPPESFVSLLRNSAFIAMGNPIGKVAVGKIYHVVGRDLYIDFGWKFPTVCTAPEKNKELYVPGARVKLLIKDLELSTKFLGGEEEITLCEADCVLLGLLSPPSQKMQNVNS